MAGGPGAATGLTRRGDSPAPHTKAGQPSAVGASGLSIANRRKFVAGLAGAALAAPAFLTGKQRTAGKPNVLFIAIDDLNDWIGCLGGHPNTRTPNLDRLARESVLFTNAHCAAPLCNPSRAALMTGIRPATSGVYTNQQPMRQSQVLRSAVTLPQHFMAHGYSAAGGGKIYHGAFPDAASWNAYFPSQTQNQPRNPEPPRQPMNGIPGARQFDWGPLDVPTDQMGDWHTTGWAIRELEKKHDRPFFLACGIYRPHLPWYVPRSFFDMFPPDKVELPVVKEDDLDDVPPAGRQMARPEGDHRTVTGHKQWRNAVASYLACIAFADACVGRLLDAFRASPHAANTVVVLWSDHGWHLGEKLHWRKFTLWEEATRNVLMVSAPGLTKAGARCSRPVSLLDVYPTLVDVCGLAKRKELEGTSLVPLLRNAEADWARPAVTTYRRNNHSVRDQRWRYIRYADGSEELYDHDRDELEWDNLAIKAEFAEVKRRLAKWLPTRNAPDSPVSDQNEVMS